MQRRENVVILPHESIPRVMTPQQKNQALVWTGAQYVLLSVLVFGGKIFVPLLTGWALIAAALALTAWALVPFRATKLHISPLVAEGGTLVIEGPYRWIRHPMYASVLLAALGAVALDPTVVRIVSALLLLPVLYSKLTLEETFLREAYHGYDSYAVQTKRLIPGIW